MKLKLHRDKVISIVKGTDMVGVYIVTTRHSDRLSKDGIEYEIPKGATILLAEFSTTKADKIIKLWNNN